MLRLRAARIAAALLLTLGSVLVLALPAQAAPARNNSKNETVYFVHGIDLFGNPPGQNCSSNFGAAISRFRSLGWTGALLTIGYYQNDTSCNVVIGRNTKETSITEIGRQLAWSIYTRDSRYGRSVDVVAHSMGGLVVRAAITGVANRTSGFPPYLYVEDVVTLSSPHAGRPGALLCPSAQCRQLSPGSSFLKSLNSNAQATGGTDWTLLGTEDDDVVPVAYATTMNTAGHYLWYFSHQSHLEHSDLTTNTTGSPRLKLWNWNTRRWINSTGSVIDLTMTACYYWSDR